MDKAIIVINAGIQDQNKIVPISPATDKMVKAMGDAIKSQGKVKVEIMPAIQLKGDSSSSAAIIYCPLTIEVPQHFVFPGQKIYQVCKDVSQLRQEVKSKLGYGVDKETSTYGDLWLPVILTAVGPVYGEVIGEGAIPNSYQQPVDLDDHLRQPLYSLAYKLLNILQAPPSVYLLQFSISNAQVIFDRLWPFPAAPALASLGQQKPDLYSCHWYCLTNQPLPQLVIKK